MVDCDAITGYTCYYLYDIRLYLSPIALKCFKTAIKVHFYFLFAFVALHYHKEERTTIISIFLNTD